MKLIDDWKFVLTRSHSMWGFYLSGASVFVGESIFAVLGMDTNPRFWWLLAAAGFFYGAIGRVIDQKDKDGTGPLVPMASIAVITFVLMALMGMGLIQRPEPPQESRAPTEAETMAVAVPLVAKWEGLRTEAYLDTIAEPDVWTICYGETKNVRPGEVRTRAQCEEGLRRGLVVYRNGLHRYFEDQTRARYLTPERDAAFVSLAYNVGIAGAGGSTATRRLNAGDIPGACDALTWWNRAGNRVIRGLVNRRADEKRLCLQGVVAAGGA